MRLLFLGTPAFAVPFLESLIGANYTPTLVVTQPDRPIGRKQMVLPTPIKSTANYHNIPTLQPEDINTEECIRALRVQQPDLIVTVAFGQIISKDVLSIPKYGCINVHPSFLPKYRGASPLQETILHGDKETGVTIILMDEKMDHGPILAQETLSLEDRETMESLIQKTTKLGKKLLIDTIREIEQGTIHSQEQDHAQATFTRLLKKEMGHIDWNRSAEEIDRQIRALNPWPGTWTEWQGKKVKIYTATPEEEIIEQTIGVFFNNNGRLFIQCGKGQLAIQTLQVEGKNIISSEEFLRGYLGKPTGP